MTRYREVDIRWYEERTTRKEGGEVRGKKREKEREKG
jgi:hypothetical protein